MKIGDKVIIERAYYENKASSWTPNMDKLIGKEVTVKDIYDYCFYPKECIHKYHYPIECIKSNIILEPTYEIY